MDGNDHPPKDSQSTETDASTPPAAAASASASTTASAPSDDLTIAQAMHAMESLTVLFGFSAEAASEAIHHVTTTTKSESGSGSGSGDLVAMCCEYILDHGLGIDSGGAIAPIDNCPHVVAKGEPSGHEPQSRGNEDGKPCGCISVAAKDVPEDIFDAPCRYFQQIEEQQKQKQQPRCKRATGGFKDDLEYSAAGGGRPTCPMGENWWCLQCGGIYCSRYVNGHGVKHFEDHQQGSNEQQHCVMIGLADLSVWCHICGSYLETHRNQRLTSILQRLQDIKFRED